MCLGQSEAPEKLSKPFPERVPLSPRDTGAKVTHWIGSGQLASATEPGYLPVRGEAAG